MPLTPEWIVAAVAVGGILFHIGYSWQTLNWLKDNAVTKTDLTLLRSEFTVENKATFVNQEYCDKFHGANADNLEKVHREIAQLRINIASAIAEARNVRGNHS